MNELLYNTISDVVKKSSELRSNLETTMSKGKPWPQTSMNAGLGDSSGFLSPLLISPCKEFATDSSLSKDAKDSKPAIKKVINYEYEDWLGQKITTNGLVPLTTSDRFDASKVLPKKDLSTPYSTRDHYLIFNDNATDYFKHGLQVINGLNPIENPTDGYSDIRLRDFKSTPFENNDPVMYGFEIVFDALSSPLLNGSVSDFITKFQDIGEISSRRPIYQDFKHQFVKFFKTNGKLNITEGVRLSSSRSNYASTDGQNALYQPWRNAYMNYYLTKAEGLELLSESNTSDAKKYITDYRKDKIKLTFSEDVSASMGTLAHLYKLLYWSKPNGKNLIPENLLRFNCDIIVSECRNFNRVIKSNGDISVIKDNLSRYVYSLKECQFFFNGNPHDGTIDMSDTKSFDNYTIEFDYKYSTTKFERFLEIGETGLGKYSGYNNGTLWKVSKDRGSTNSANIDTPKFFTSGTNSYRQNGVEKPLVLKKYGANANYKDNANGTTVDEKVENQDNENVNKIDDIEALKKRQLSLKKGEDNTFNIAKEVADKSNILNNAKTTFKDSLGKNSKNYIDRLKESTVKNVKNEIAKLVNNRINLLSRTVNKLGIGFVGGKGVRPPNNVYTPDQGALGNALSNVSDRLFYDIRNELTDFAGDSLSNFLNSSINSFKKR